MKHETRQRSINMYIGMDSLKSIEISEMATPVIRVILNAKIKKLIKT